ncbi:MAG: flagellar basal body-associated FliL family protein [Pseudomonadota bacterium]
MRLFPLILAAGMALPAAPPAQGSAKPAAEGTDTSVGAEAFIRVEPIIISVLRGSTVAGLMSLTVELQVPDAAKREEVAAIRPRLRDGYLRALSRLASTTLDIDRPLNFELLTRMLQRDTDRVLGPGVARVLITDASTRQN